MGNMGDSVQGMYSHLCSEIVMYLIGCDFQCKWGLDILVSRHRPVDYAFKVTMHSKVLATDFLPNQTPSVALHLLWFFIIALFIDLLLKNPLWFSIDIYA